MKTRLLVITKSNVISHFCPVLEKSGFSVHLEKDEGQGISWAIKQNPDLIVVGEELGNPGFAEGMIPEILNWRKKAKIVVVFADNNPHLIERVIGVGAAGVVTIGGNIPASQVELVGKIKSVLRER